MIESICKFCGKPVIKRGSVPAVFCNRACKGDWQRQQKPVDREWLYQKYIVEGMSATQIASLVQRDSKRVWEWLQDYGIETRKRGTTGNGFKAGELSRFAGHKHTPESRAFFRELRLKDGHVPYLKDGKHHLKGKRGSATPNWKGGVTPERQRVYDSREWKDAVLAVWERDNAKCQKCGLDYRTVNRNLVRFAIHHIISFANKEKRCDPNNLILLCQDCHHFVHSNANSTREFLA